VVEKELNSYVEEYDIKFTILNGGRIGVTYNTIWNYFYSDSSKIVTGQSNPNQVFEKHTHTSLVGDEVEIELTKTLQYMLGMDDLVVHPLVQELKKFILQYNPSVKDNNWFYFMNIACQKGDYPFATTYMGKYLPDINNRLDRMFIYCDQVENLAIHMRVYWLS
jgi:hypothetical protein